MNKVQWSVSLANGETLYENKGNFLIIEGALSPWQRLLSYMGEKGTRITSLSLYTDDGMRWNLPSAGKVPKFRELEIAEKPVSYRFFRKAGIDRNLKGQEISRDTYSVIEATYDDGSILQVWVDNATGNSWCIKK